MRTVACLLLCLLLAGLGAAAAAAEDETPIMPVAQVQRGMTGYGLTSLGKEEPEKFNVEVVGVIHGWAPKGNIVMVKLSGAVMEQTNGFQGMSGSPVYIDGKLLGAVAYGWPFSKTPLAGVTPAEEMMKVRSLEGKAGPEAAAAAKARSRQEMRRRMGQVAQMLLPGKDAPPDPSTVRQALMRASVPLLFTDAARRAVPLDFAGLPGAALPRGAGALMQPLPIPLMVGGTLADTSALTPLSEGGLVPVQGVPAGPAAAPAAAPAQVKLTPGMPIGTAFISGDVDIYGMGTLTWVNGNQVLAFGHPLFGAGDVDLPMVLGHSPIIVASLQSSFRMTESGPVIGSITQDRDSGILGELGHKAEMFPCTVRVHGVADDTYNYQVAGFWQTAPYFTLLAVEMTSSRWQGEGNPYDLTAEVQISLKGIDKPLVLQNDYADYSVVGPSYDLIMTPLSELMTNPFRKVEVSKVDFDLDVRPGREVATVESLELDRPQAAPGSDVTLYVRLKTYRGETVVKQIPLHIPETATPGSTANVLVSDAASNRVIDRQLDPGFYDPQSFDELMEVLGKMDSNRSLVVRAAFMDRGLRYAGSPMPALPPSAVGVMDFNGGAGRTSPLVKDVRFTVPMPYVLSGTQMVSIAIKEPDPLNP